MSYLTLASVEEAFQQWRAGRQSRAEVIPKALWSMALGIYPQYKRSKICRHLQLSGGQFKQRLDLDNDRNTRANHGFVLASRDEHEAMLKVAQVCIEHNVPFLVLRTISGKADHSAAIDFQAFVDQVASHYSFEILREYLA